MAIKYQKVAAKLAIFALAFVALNIGSNNIYDLSSSDIGEQPRPQRKEKQAHRKQLGWDTKNHPIAHQVHYNGGDILTPPQVGYFNLSCPFEWSKYSCAYMQRGPKAEEIVRTSTEYYLQHIDMIQAAFDRAASKPAKRILFTGDSLMRQIFIGIACNAATILQGNNLIDYAAIPWKEGWPCKNKEACFITSGVHGGFDAASIRFTNGMELHFVPHKGFKDEETSETNILERLREDMQTYGRITFGEKTAMPPGGMDVDVLVYNVGIHYGLGMTRKMLNHFVNWISKPLMGLGEVAEVNRANKNAYISQGGDSTINQNSRRTKTIYITTPAQHYNTPNGQWQQGMTRNSKTCIDSISSNPRAELEKEILLGGANVDVLLDYDDLELGNMHVRKGHDCSHYCMPGVPDVVGARLLKELL